jgi:hypothetical protein
MERKLKAREDLDNKIKAERQKQRELVSFFFLLNLKDIFYKLKIFFKESTIIIG